MMSDMKEEQEKKLLGLQKLEKWNIVLKLVEKRELLAIMEKSMKFSFLTKIISRRYSKVPMARDIQVNSYDLHSIEVYYLYLEIM